MTYKISIANDFSKFPSGRYLADGDYTGERFREEFLKPSLEQHDVVEVDLAGTRGYGSSFLEESFGGLVREGYFTSQELEGRLIIFASDENFETYVDEAKAYINEAKAIVAP